MALAAIDLYQDLRSLYPQVQISPLEPGVALEQRIKTIFTTFVSSEFSEYQHTALRSYQLVHEHGALALCYAAEQILQRMAQLQQRHPDHRVHALFSGRDATGLWLITRALQCAKAQPTDALHLVYLSRPVVQFTTLEDLRQYLEDATASRTSESLYVLIDIGWVGSRLLVLQRALQGHICGYYLLFSRFRLETPNVEHVGLIDGLGDPLSEIAPPPDVKELDLVDPLEVREEFFKKEIIRLRIKTPEVSFVEDLFSGDFREVQLLVRKEGEQGFAAFPVLHNLRHERFSESVPRLFALLALVDRIAEMRQAGRFPQLSRQDARHHMSVVLQNFRGIFPA